MLSNLRNIGIINSTTRSHLVGYFYTIYIMMHGSMNIKLIVHVIFSFDGIVNDNFTVC